MVFEESLEWEDEGNSQWAADVDPLLMSGPSPHSYSFPSSNLQLNLSCSPSIYDFSKQSKGTCPLPTQTCTIYPLSVLCLVFLGSQACSFLVHVWLHIALVFCILPFHQGFTLYPCHCHPSIFLPQHLHQPTFPSLLHHPFSMCLSKVCIHL